MSKIVDFYEKAKIKGVRVLIKKVSNEFNAVTRQKTKRPEVQYEAYGFKLPASQGRVSGFDNKSLGMTRNKQRFWKIAAHKIPYEIEEGFILIEPETGDEYIIAGSTPYFIGSDIILYNVGCYK